MFVPQTLQLLCNSQGCTQGGGVWLKPPILKLDILQIFITCATEIKCFRILLLVNLST